LLHIQEYCGLVGTRKAALVFALDCNHQGRVPRLLDRFGIDNAISFAMSHLGDDADEFVQNVEELSRDPLALFNHRIVH